MSRAVGVIFNEEFNPAVEELLRNYVASCVLRAEARRDVGAPCLIRGPPRAPMQLSPRGAQLPHDGL